MDDKKREISSNDNVSGNKEGQSNTDDEGSQSNSEEESSQSNSEEENERYTALMNACQTGNVAVVHKILKFKYTKGKRNNSLRDEDLQTALSFVKQSNNAEIVAMIEQKLFLRAVGNGDTDTVKTYLSTKESNSEVLYCRAETDILTYHHEHYYEQIELQSHQDDPSGEPQPKKFKREIEARFSSKYSITHSVWLKAVDIAQDNDHDEMLNLLFADDRFLYEFDKNGLTILHLLLAVYLEIELEDGYDSKQLKAIEILLKSAKFSASVLNSKKQTIFEFMFDFDSEHCSQLDDLLRVFLQNGFDLNGRNENGETFLMLACKEGRLDIVRSLIKLASRDFVLDIDAVDKSGETAFMKAKEQDFYEIVVPLLKFKLISAVKDKNVDVVKSMQAEFRNILDISVKSWSSNNELDRLHEMCEKGETKSDIWLEAIYMAMGNETKHSEEILKLLLDCDFLLSQEIQTGYYSFEQLVRIGDDDKKLRLIGLLLEYGKINVNHRDQNGRTALHWAEEEKLISLLISYGAGVNKKDYEGKTPLISILEKSSINRFQVLRTLLEEAGTVMNLDAMDCDGRTALMHAVMLNHSSDVDLLLNKGASVNLSDHLGFTALHHALHGNINDHLNFPRNSEEFKKITTIPNLFDAEDREEGGGEEGGGKEERNEERMKIVKMLLKTPDIDVNFLSIEKFSPLDIAEGQIPEIPSSIKDALKKKGAVLSAYTQTESQSTSDFHLDITCKLTLEQLVKTYKALYSKNADFLKERLQSLIETCKELKYSDKDQQGRTALHLFAISSYRLLIDGECIGDLANAIVDKLITIGCSVNETDIFGRTPLHYANKLLCDLLKLKNADASVKDEYGNIAILKKRKNRSKPCEFVRIRIMVDKKKQTSSSRKQEN